MLIVVIDLFGFMVSRDGLVVVLFLIAVQIGSALIIVSVVFD